MCVCVCVSDLPVPIRNNFLGDKELFKPSLLQPPDVLKS